MSRHRHMNPHDSEGRGRPDFFELTILAFPSCSLQPYEAMTGPIAQRVLSYSISY